MNGLINTMSYHIICSHIQNSNCCKLTTETNCITIIIIPFHTSLSIYTVSFNTACQPKIAEIYQAYGHSLPSTAAETDER